MTNCTTNNVCGFICGPRLYKYKGWFFEVNPSCGPWPLKKDGELRKRAGLVFYGIFDQFNNEKDKEQFRVGGGCVEF
jgi:hypothetical protein